jgi:hypothetical protein
MVIVVVGVLLLVVYDERLFLVVCLVMFSDNEIYYIMFCPWH